MSFFADSPYRVTALAAGGLIVFVGIAYIVFLGRQSQETNESTAPTPPATTQASASPSSSAPSNPNGAVSSTPAATSPATATPTPTVGANTVSIQGKMVCLPHKNTDGPQTMECAFGMQALDGTYYALRDTDPTYKNVSGVGIGASVLVTGTLTLGGSIMYQDAGTIAVTSLQKL